MKVFLGGTCNGSTWRDKLILLLECDYFNPVVKDWTPECQEEEIRQRQECDICLYVITPLVKGFYSIAEVVEDSIKRPEKTVFAWLKGDLLLVFPKAELKSLAAVGAMVESNGGMVVGEKVSPGGDVFFTSCSLWDIADAVNGFGNRNAATVGQKRLGMPRGIS